jgi:hypothetical protein
LQLPWWTSHYALGKTCWKYCRSDEDYKGAGADKLNMHQVKQMNGLCGDE